MKFEDRLRELRLENNLTQGALADMLQVSRSSISMYERGEREPDLETIDLFADFFNVDFDYMIGKENGSVVYMDHKAAVIGKKLSDRPNLQKLMDYFSTLPESQLESYIAVLRIGENDKSK